MKFLCDQHRQWLAARPFAARHFWHKALGCARNAVRNNDWSLAIRQYAKALDIADVLLDRDVDREISARRYCCSAVELGYALRYNLHSLEDLMTAVNGRLRCVQCSKEANDLIESLIEINRSGPGRSIAPWESSCRQLQHSENATVH